MDGEDEGMAFFESFVEMMVDRPLHLKAPHFYKADSDARRQLAELTEFSKVCPKAVLADVEQDIRLLSYGIAGEEQVAFELANSYLPMIVLHDLHIEADGLSAQIDFLVITPKINLIIECKNLYGNIEVTSNGDFIRKMEYNGHLKKEGIYSPITQNIRHLEMIRKVRGASKNNFLTRTLFEKNFDSFYKSVVVLANPKTIIDLKYAKKEVKNQIIRCDQLVDHIKKLQKESDEMTSPEKSMYDMADFFLKLHTPNTTDYRKKYGVVEVVDEGSVEASSVEASANHSQEETAAVGLHAAAGTGLANDTNIEDTPIYKALKQYRLETSKAEGVKAYFIYNNAEMLAIIAAMPATLEDLKKISGFGEVKCQKYGEKILEIVREMRG